MNRMLRELSFTALFISAFLAGTISQAEAQTAKQRAKAIAAARNKAAAEKAKPPKIVLPIDKAPRTEITVAPVDPSRKTRMKSVAMQIDHIVVDHLRSKGARANPPISDEVFLRRIYLDITGTIPTLEQARSFLESTAPDKRSELIDELLNAPGYASHHYNYWADVLRIVDQPDGNNYLRPYGDWIKQSFRDNTHWNVMVRQMLTAEGKVWENPPAGYKLRDDGMPLDNLNNTVRIFLGTRIGCAQCHDHPFDRWTQREFYELAAFEGGVRTRNYDRELTMAQREAVQSSDRRLIGQVNRLVNYNRKEVIETNNKLRFPHDYAYDDAKPKALVEPNVIFGSMPRMDGNTPRREAFAAWLTSNDNPRFALTIANRMWQRVIGVGLIDPVDDITEDTSPSIPALMDLLVSEMKRVDYDLKEFLRILYNTHIYQRQATVIDPADPTAEYLVTGPIMRRMSAEQVWDSMLTLTLEDPDSLIRHTDAEFCDALALSPGITAAQLISTYPRLQESAKEQRATDRTMEYKKIVLRRASELPQPVPADHFLRQFGQSDRTIISNNSTEGTVPQLLTMFNGPVTHMMLEPGSLLVNKVTSNASLNDRVDTIFLSILSRYPTEDQKLLAKKIVAEYKIPGYGDIIWSLLNTREFVFIQ
ncbi:hypothetical protein Poly24_26080 [Rosistilla carotiformis]|uniref:DUF1549 domain-containing protein n=1 Tax=Rosistilla carotiformis TaxID=2528017 RepID=A0A518JTM5_9BACT|nr:DUF1549 and DUF1553 domain-containing protein [Rosistilla carotiformis]QDV68895.1 hypothetical protein Poly24_26080 [Rosistilla carotiformis]